MKILKHHKNEVEFKDLVVGDVFSDNGEVFMRIEGGYALCLSTCAVHAFTPIRQVTFHKDAELKLNN